jgi:hypothetical protein
MRIANVQPITVAEFNQILVEITDLTAATITTQTDTGARMNIASARDYHPEHVRCLLRLPSRTCARRYPERGHSCGKIADF